MNITSPEACGLGQEKYCCIFLAVGNTGWICGREDPGLKEVIEKKSEEGTMHAKYHPGPAPFPICQPFSQD